MPRISRSQIRANRHQNAITFLLLAGLVLLTAGGVATNIETQDGLDHTKHLCTLWSYVAVVGSFAGFVCMALAALICGADA